MSVTILRMLSRLLGRLVMSAGALGWAMVRGGAQRVAFGASKLVVLNLHANNMALTEDDVDWPDTGGEPDIHVLEIDDHTPRDIVSETHGEWVTRMRRVANLDAAAARS